MNSELQKRKYYYFANEWELLYFCQASDGEAQCLLCKKQLFCKSYNIKRHYDTFHAAVYSKYEGEARKALLLELKAVPQGAIMETDINDNSLNAKRVSFEISLELVRKHRTFSDGEIVKSCIMKAVSILSEGELHKYQSLSLSRRTIARRVQQMGVNIESQLKMKISSFVAASLAIDESTDVTDIAQLAIFIRGVDVDFNVTEELLDLIEMKNTTTGADIFKCVTECMNRMGLSWSTLVCVATDGAKSMTGSKSGLIARMRQKLQEENPNHDFVAIHCLVHQEALCAKSVALKNVMNVVVKCVNLVRAHGLSHRQFKEFLADAEEEHGDIPFYSEIRWLSRAKTLARFFELRQQVHEFLENKGKIFPELLQADWIADLAFLTDITQHLNDLNVALLGRNKLIFEMSDEIDAFKAKVTLWIRQIKEKDFFFFPRLLSISSTPTINEIKYVDELTLLRSQFEDRFAELTPLKEKFSLFTAPFTYDAYNAPKDLQMELISLQCSTIMRSVLGNSDSITNFYKGLCSLKFPNLKKFAAKIIALFGSTYSCEQFFSALKLNKYARRSRFSESTFKNVMRVATTRTINPNIDELLSASNDDPSLDIL